MSSTGSIAGHPVVTGLRTAAGALDPDALGLGWQLADDEVETALATVQDLRARTAAVEAMLLREAGTRDLKARTQASSTVRWLGDRFRLSRADANARVRVAEALGRHPVLSDALGSGAVTGEQAEALTPVLDAVAALPGLHEEERAAAGRFLVAQCATLTPRELARAGGALVEALTVTPSVDDPADAGALAREQERAEAEAQEAERNVLTVTRRRGRLLAILEPGVIGEAVLQEWVRKNEKKHAGCDGFEDTRPRSERLGDAMVDLLTAAAGLPTPRVAPDSDGPPPSTTVLTVTTTVDGLQSGLARMGRLDTGLAMSAAALRMLACDALIVPAVLGTPSEVLDLGRAYRDFNRAQRRAAALRDRGCVAPGCDQPPAACHVHHMWWWIEGGPTDLDNAALLCGFHHRMVHRQGWAMTLAPNGYPHLVPPKTIDPHQRPRQHHRFLIPDQRDPASTPGLQRT